MTSPPGTGNQEKGPNAALPREFYQQDTLVVARSLLNCVLVRDTVEGRVTGRISETEAYQHDEPSSHSYRGRTSRNAVMFGPAGFAYVYFTYGMHFCFNVVTSAEGIANAVLIRALEPLTGPELMSRRRGLPEEEIARQYRTGDPRLRQRWSMALCGGPGKLCQAFAIAREDNGTDLTMGAGLTIVPPQPGTSRPGRVLATPRIGIRQAVELPWRFALENDPYTSRK